MSPEQNSKSPIIPNELPDIRRVLLALRSEDAVEAEEAREQFLRSLSKTALAALIETSYFDASTQLGNKHVLHTVIQESLESKTSSLVIMSDLVKFSEINEKHGHAVGDKFIAAAALALYDTLRDDSHHRAGDDMIFDLADSEQDGINGDGYRFGGDEFIAILRNGDGLKTADHEQIVRTKMRAVLSNQNLHELMRHYGVFEFGIRAGYAYVDASLHGNSEDVIIAADPKTATVCQYVVSLPAEDTFLVQEVS